MHFHFAECKRFSGARVTKASTDRREGAQGCLDLGCDFSQSLSLGDRLQRNSSPPKSRSILDPHKNILRHPSPKYS